MLCCVMIQDVPKMFTFIKLYFTDFIRFCFNFILFVLIRELLNPNNIREYNVSKYFRQKYKTDYIRYKIYSDISAEVRILFIRIYTCIFNYAKV